MMSDTATFPSIDPAFAPPFKAWREKTAAVGHDGTCVSVAVERANGRLFSHSLTLGPAAGSDEERYSLVERTVKFILWSRGGFRIHYQGPEIYGRRLAADYSAGGARKFDFEFMSGIYQKRLEIVTVPEGSAFPKTIEGERRLGGNFDGCRLGFDLGASDFKLAAVMDGKPVFTEEVPWNPGAWSDPGYHYRAIMSGLKRAASHLPRVDAVGGSSAGVLIDNRFRTSSLFRSVPPGLFDEKVKDMFLDMSRELNVPFEVLNDGEVTALAGMMALGEKAVLGIAMGSSEAAGYVNGHGFLTGGLDELAFAPVDLDPAGPVDEWSGDRGVGADYFSQQAVNRLALAAGMTFPALMRLPERLKVVQKLADAGDPRTLAVFETIGKYLGHTIPWYESFYLFHHLLVLGRVMSGKGGDIIVGKAGEVLEKEYPETASRVKIHLLGENSRRLGQAVTAASLPRLGRRSV